MKLTPTKEAVNVTIPTLFVKEKFVFGKYFYNVRIEFLGTCIHQQLCRELQLLYSGYAYSRKGEIIKNVERRLKEMRIKKLEVREEKFVPGGKDGLDASTQEI